MAIAFSKLTRPAMRKLPPGKKLTEHGITFERSAQGDGMFSVNIMVDGQRIHRVVGRDSDGTTRTQAEEFISKVRTDARHDRLSLPKGRKVALGFRAAATRYLERLKEEGGKDLKAKRHRLTLNLTPFFGDTPLTRINSFDVERYKKHRQHEKARKSTVKGETAYKQEPPSPGTINRELAVLSHLLNKAVEWGWLDRRPAVIRRLRENGGRISYLTVEQAKSLLEAALADGNAQIYPFIVIGLDTAMRMTEILSIRREHLHLDRRIIHIPHAKAGTREQPITAHLAEFLRGYLAALPQSIPWLFPSPGAKSGHTASVRKPFRRVVTAAGLDPDQVVRHTLRHTAITHLVQAGVDLPTVKRISGHKTLIMVERYAHANGEHIRSAMDKLEERYRPTG
ncbi:MAG: site-specific integrase [Gammaproteobacteria bacterium]|nr:site-specific integrase [Gammaproteobacteria bacterium]